MKRFEGKVVLVTGGSTGIGRSTAEAFGREGAKVVIAARREREGLEAAKAVEQAGGTARFLRTDVAKEDEVKAAVAYTVKTFGRLDVLFNNAGIEGRNGPITELSAADFDDTFGVNVKGLWLAIKHALPELKKSGGNVVNVGSVVADIGFPGTSIYSASKGAVHALTRAAAIELIKEGVRVNAVSPGPVVTEMAARVFGSSENLNGFAKSAVPAGRAGVAEEIAEAVLYLASPEAKFTVGHVLTVDGGFSQA